MTIDFKDGKVTLIQKARDYLKKYDVVIQRVYREGNKLVDGLVSMAWGQTLQSVFYYSHPVSLLDQLGVDWCYVTKNCICLIYVFFLLL